MSITRSQIARQLLAEGGAPRKGFFEGSPAYSGPSNDPSFGDTGDFGSESENVQQNLSAFSNVPDAVGMEQTPRSPNLIETFGDNFANISPLRMINRFDEKFLKPGRDIRNEKLRRNYLINEGIIRSGPVGDEDLEAQGFIGDLSTKAGLDFARSKGYKTVDDMRDEGLGGDNEPMIRRLRAPITEAAEKEEPKNEFNELLKFYGSRFADGGEVRQGYGLGSIVKKAKSAVGKVFKSPLGKAAILAFGAKFAKPDIFANAFAKDSFIMKNKALSGILAASLASGALAKQDEDDDEKLPTVAQSDPEFQNLLAYYGGPTRFAAKGGDIEDAPKEKPSGIMMASNIENDEILENLFEKYLEMGLSPKDAADKARQEFDKMSKVKEPDRMTAQEGGLMNLGGNEMDLRGGGFVPLGAKEKADDVPARLSKNEFVFTADAVRAAGGGSVDRGADIMYKTMKNLENKVA